MNERLLVIDKEPGPTSFDVVRRVKKLYPHCKVGHTGSLDPFASGVLIIMVGRATKLSDLLLNADKGYRAVLKLGEATETMDGTGPASETLPVPALSEAKIGELLNSYEGTWNQTPPMYSAKKIHGVRLYELARKNIKVRRQPIPVQLYEVNLLSWKTPFVEFEVRCSKGTYVRALADEIGRRLGTVAHLHGLRRTSCGVFSLKDCVLLKDLERDSEKWAQVGYENYVSFLRSERLLRPREPSLQSAARGGNSFLGC